MWQKLKVIELASVLAGPLVGSFFAELGAEVIKIENKTSGGDLTRNWKLASEDASKTVSAYYASANYKKKSLFLDLTSREDYAQTIKLIKEADIVIQNFKAGDAKKLKLHSEYLLTLNPKLIVAELSGFGPNNTRPAFDVVLQAETGFMYMNGNATSGPIKMPVALIDVLAAHHLKEAILIALFEKTLSGKGKVVHISLYDAAIASLANQASNFLMEQHIPEPIGTEHPNIAPYGDMYKSKDGKYVVLAVGSEKQFQLLSAQFPNLKTKKDLFKSNALRVINRKILNEKIATEIALMTSLDLEKIFLKKGIPFGIVKNLKEVFLDKKAHKLIQDDQIELQKTKRVKTLLM
jgi:crotonobetainyl-CoA:carnitine CoA-transferase CaiB-like acyl-CoA transferase